MIVRNVLCYNDLTLPHPLQQRFRCSRSATASVVVALVWPVLLRVQTLQSSIDHRRQGSEGVETTGPLGFRVRHQDRRRRGGRNSNFTRTHKKRF